MIPILKDHDQGKNPIGKITQTHDNGRLRVELREPMTNEQVFDTFGNAGLLIYEMIEDNGILKISVFEITHWSLDSRLIEHANEAETKVPCNQCNDFISIEASSYDGTASYFCSACREQNDRRRIE